MKTTHENTRHRFGDSRDQNGARPTMPPRTRPGKAFPGGKHLRRALAKLSLRQNFAKGRKPGSMKA